jgi:16S rRNA (guanine527-N7)-methyltransferase
METGPELIFSHFPALDENQRRQFAALGPLYEEWNAKINVISRRDISSLHLHHVLHSLAIARVFSFADGQRVMDIGAGGGFPCVPLAILFPRAKFTAVDSVGKKLKVVEAVTAGAGITNLDTLHARAEDIRGRKFGAVVSRAVAPLPDLIRWTAHLLEKPVRPGLGAGSIPGTAHGLVCLKGGDLADEIAAARRPVRKWPVRSFFDYPFFDGKVILQVD